MRNALSLEQIERLAPAVFATEPDESLSDRYLFVPTIQVVEGLMDNGFIPVQAGQTNVNKQSNLHTARHVLRFRHEKFEQARQNVGDEIPELVLLNSHDGTSRYSLSLGIFRLVCSNGMIVNSGLINEIKVKHLGRDELLNDVIDASYQVVQDAPKAIGQLEDWKGIDLAPFEQEAFAEAALDVRGTSLEVPASELLRFRRYKDKGNDLWTTFNVVQENLIRGGVRGKDSNGRFRRIQGVNSVNKDTQLNKALWKMAEKLAEAKQNGDDYSRIVSIN